jgi:hypothetical protein
MVRLRVTCQCFSGTLSGDFFVAGFIGITTLQTTCMAKRRSIAGAEKLPAKVVAGAESRPGAAS